MFYKNYVKDSLIYNELMVNKRVIVSESLNLFKWKILADKDTLILGYKCQKATSDFRGRKYEAYFSSALHPFGGAWKFDGLPGLILSVKSLDKFFVVNPIKIIINDKTHSVSNPYKGEKNILTWDSFVLQFEKKLKQILKMMKADSAQGEGGSIKITDKIEDMGIKEMSFN